MAELEALDADNAHAVVAFTAHLSRLVPSPELDVELHDDDVPGGLLWWRAVIVPWPALATERLLPDADAVRADLAAGLDDTLALLADAPEDDTGLYFFRLALFHEDMHAEAAVYMAQTLGVAPRHLPPAVAATAVSGRTISDRRAAKLAMTAPSSASCWA